MEESKLSISGILTIEVSLGARLIAISIHQYTPYDLSALQLHAVNGARFLIPSAIKLLRQSVPVRWVVPNVAFDESANHEIG